MRANCLLKIPWVMVVIIMVTASVACPEAAKKSIHFPRGSTSTTIAGNVLRGERDTYVLSARAQQQMRVRMTSLEDNAVFQIYKPGKKETLDGAGEGEDARVWRGTLPVSGDYTIVVGGTRGNASYKLEVSLQ